MLKKVARQVKLVLKHLLEWPEYFAEELGQAFVEFVKFAEKEVHVDGGTKWEYGDFGAKVRGPLVIRGRSCTFFK